MQFTTNLSICQLKNAFAFRGGKKRLKGESLAVFTLENLETSLEVSTAIISFDKSINQSDDAKS